MMNRDPFTFRGKGGSCNLNKAGIDNILHRTILQKFTGKSALCVRQVSLKIDLEFAHP